MKSTEETTHAFIVRIWLEHQDIKDQEPIWRGVIEHVEIVDVGDEKPVYFNDLDKMSSYLSEYLQKIGIKMDDCTK